MRETNTFSEILHDRDGTMTREGKESYITYWRAHFDGIAECKKVTDNYAQPMAVCDGTKI